MGLGVFLRVLLLLVERVIGGRERRARASLALRRVIAPRVVGHRPRAHDLGFGPEVDEEVVTSASTATSQSVLDTSRAAGLGLASVRETVVEWPHRRIYQLRHGLIHGPTGLVLHRGRHIVQSGPANRADIKCFAADHHVVEDLWLIEQFGDGRLVTVDGPVHHTGPFGGNYYHWLIDVLPRILHARRVCPELTVVVPEAPGFAVATLDALGVTHITTTSSVAAGSIVVLDPGVSGWLHPEDVDLLRGLASTIEPHASDPGSRPSCPGVYVSRSGSDRELREERVLEEALAQRGFLILRADSLPDWIDQVALFSSSRFVIGPHGAGLANLVFAPKDAHLIELLPPALNIEGTPGPTGDFLRLATVLGIRYSPVRLVRGPKAPYGDASSVLDTVLDLITAKA